MSIQEPSKTRDKQLLVEVNKPKLTPAWSALAIGILAGIVIYSVAMNTWGFLTLIPLYFIYKMVKGNDKSKA